MPARHRPLLAALLALAASFVAAAPRASATVLAPMAFEAQCREAGRIFVGRVTAVESRRNPDAPKYFQTLVTFAVEQNVAGTSGSEVALRFTGGTVDGARQWIDGMPEFAAGERYVVMTGAPGGPPMVSPIVGFNQGLYRVETAPGATRAYVRDRTGAPLAQTWPATGIGIPDALRSDTQTDTLELGAFVRAIEAARR